MFWKSLDTINDKAKTNIKKGIVKTFKDIETEVLSSISSYFKSVKHYKKELNIELFNIDSFMNEIISNTEKAFQSQMYDVISYLRNELETQIPPSDLDMIISEATYKTSNLIKESINTIHKDLKQIIQKIISENTDLTREELKDKIIQQTKDKFSLVYNVSRADLIASTTATFNLCLTQKIVCKKLDYNYVWLSQRDSVVRSSHREMDGKAPDNNGIFHLRGGSGEHPGAISSAAESCHCRCYLLPRKKE